MEEHFLSSEKALTTYITALKPNQDECTGFIDGFNEALSLFAVSGQLPELFRNFIRTNHLTSKWEDYLKENEGNLH